MTPEVVVSPPRPAASSLRLPAAPTLTDRPTALPTDWLASTPSPTTALDEYIDAEKSSEDRHVDAAGGLWYLFSRGLLEILGKFGVPFKTITKLLDERHSPDAVRERVVFRELAQQPTLMAGYDLLTRNTGLQYPPKEALRWIFRYMFSENTPPWPLGPTELEFLSQHGHGLYEVLHEAEIVAAPQHQLALNAFRQAFDAAAARQQEIAPSIVEQALRETNARQRFLLTGKSAIERTLIAQVLQSAAPLAQQAPQAALLTVRVGPYVVSLPTPVVTAHVAPAHTVPGNFAAFLDHAAHALTNNTPLTPSEDAQVAALIESSPSFKIFLAQQTQAIDTAVDAQERGRTLLALARDPAQTALRYALFLTQRQPGKSFGLRIEGQPPMELRWGTSGAGHGLQLIGRVEPSYYLGPYFTEHGATLVITNDQRVQQLPALVLTDRRGERLYLTSRDMERITRTAEYLQQHPRHGGRAYHDAFADFYADLQAAWIANGLGSAAHVPERITARIAEMHRTNWGIGLLQQVNALWEEVLALHSAPPVVGEHPQAARVLLAHQVEMQVDVLREQYAPHFDEVVRDEFARALADFPRAVTDAQPHIFALKDRIVQLVTRQYAAEGASDSWLTWGVGSANFADEIRHARDLIIAENRQYPDDVRSRMQWLVRGRQQRELPPSLARARDLFAARSSMAGLEELQRIIQTPHIDADTRLTALGLLAHHGAAQGQWAQVDLAFRELAQAVAEGKNIPSATLDLVIEVLTGAHATALPITLPKNLARVLSERLDASAEETPTRIAWAEAPARAADQLPILATDFSPLAQRWELLPEPVRMEIDAFIADTRANGLLAAPEFLRAIALLDAPEFRRLMYRWYGHRPGLFAQELRRLEPFREIAFRQIGQGLSAHGIPRTRITEQTGEFARDWAPLLLPDPPLAPDSESQLWVNDVIPDALPTPSSAPFLSDVRFVTGNALVGGGVLYCTRVLVQEFLPPPGSPLESFAQQWTVMGGALTLDAILQRGAAELTRASPAWPGLWNAPFSWSRFAGQASLGMLTYRGVANLTQWVAPDLSPHLVDGIGVVGAGFIMGGAQAIIARRWPGAIAALETERSTLLRTVGIRPVVASAAEGLVARIAASLQRFGLLYFFFDTTLAFANAAYSSALPDLQRSVRSERYAAQQEYLRAHRWFGAAPATVGQRAWYSMISVMDSIVPEAAHEFGDDLWHADEQKTRAREITAAMAERLAPLRYQQYTYPMAVALMGQATAVMASALVSNILRQVEDAHPVHLRDLCRALFDHESNNYDAAAANALQSWQDFATRELASSDAHWLFRNEFVARGAPTDSDALLYFLHEWIAPALQATRQAVRREITSADTHDSDLAQLDHALIVLDAFDHELTRATERFLIRRPTLSGNIWAYPYLWPDTLPHPIEPRAPEAPRRQQRSALASLAAANIPLATPQHHS